MAGGSFLALLVSKLFNNVGNHLAMMPKALWTYAGQNPHRRQQVNLNSPALGTEFKRALLLRQGSTEPVRG